MALVSVVIPAHNRIAYLRESIRSVRAQTVGEVEILVVDDASPNDISGALARDPLFQGVRFLRHEENLGPGESRRTGILAATGAYVAFLDDDDLLEPECLRTAISVMDADPSIGLFCCDGLLIDANGDVLQGGGTFNAVNAEIYGYPIETGIRSLEQVFLHPTVGIGFVVRKSVFERVSYPTTRHLEDYDFQLRVAAAGLKVFYLHAPLARYRMHGDNASGPRAAVRMCEQMVVTLREAVASFPAVRHLGWRASRRIARVRTDLGIACLQDGQIARGLGELSHALSQYPPLIGDVTWRVSRGLLRRLIRFRWRMDVRHASHTQPLHDPRTRQGHDLPGNAPAVSFVTTTFNRPEYLRECMASIRAQTVKDIEIIVVDDASDRASMEALKAEPVFAGVRFLRHYGNKGHGEARRTGIAAAHGRYIALHDDDDLWDPTIVERALTILEQDPSLGLFCCDAIMIDASGVVLNDGRTFHDINAAIKGFPIGTGKRTLEDIFLFSTIAMGVVVRREVFEKTSYPASRFVSDYEFQLWVATAGFSVFYLHEALGKYRIHGGNYSGERWMARTCKRKVEILEDALTRAPRLRQLGWRWRHRVADARLELAIGWIKAGKYSRAIWALARSMGQDPRQAKQIGRLGVRWLLRQKSA